MDINKLAQFTNLQLNELKQIFTNLEQGKNKTGSQNLKSTNSKLLSKIFLILDKLDKPMQKTVLKTWAKMNIPLREKNITQMVNYLNNNSISATEQKLIIKACAFLIKNKLPLLPVLIKGISHNINPHISLTETLNNNSSTKPLPASIKNNIALNLELPAVEISEDMESYSQKIIEIISLLKNSSSKRSDKILQHLLGQQTLNSKEREDNNNILLTIEIPVQLPEDKQLYPLYFQIEKYYKQKKQTTENTVYKISFIIELPEIGEIKSNIAIEGKTIYSQFLTTSEDTLKLIKNNFHLLQQKLEELDYNIKTPIIKQLSADDENKDPGLPWPIFDSNEQNSTKEYTHIDIKI